jgi:hypothetical protein
MSEFIQIFWDKLVPTKPLLRGLTFSNSDEIQAINHPFPEHIIEDHVNIYVQKLTSCINFFHHDGKSMKIRVKSQYVMFPTWTYSPFRPENPGGAFNFYLYLTESPLVEIFNPFNREIVQFKAVPGLLVIFPAFWGVNVKHHSTKDKNMIFISGAILPDFNNQQQS